MSKQHGITYDGTNINLKESYRMALSNGFDDQADEISHFFLEVKTAALKHLFDGVFQGIDDANIPLEQALRALGGALAARYDNGDLEALIHEAADRASQLKASKS